MAINFNQFSTGNTALATDKLVGFNNTNPNGERQWTLSTIANAVSGIMNPQLSNITNLNTVNSPTVGLNWNSSTRTLSADIIASIDDKPTSLPIITHPLHTRFGVIKNYNQLFVWGENYNDLIGDGNLGYPEAYPEKARLLPFFDSSDNPYIANNQNVKINKVLLSMGFGMALLDDGTVWLNGNNAMLGVSNPATNNTTKSFRKVLFSDSAQMKDITMSTNGTTNAWETFGSISTTNNAYLWGYNDRGQLGYSGHSNVPTKITTVGIINNVKQLHIAGGNYANSAIVTNDGYLWCSGYNGYGQLGTGNTLNLSIFTQAKINSTTFLSNVSSVVASNWVAGYNQYVIKTDGTVWGAGDNSSYQLGDGTTTDSLYFKQISGLSNVIKIVTCGYANYTSVLALNSSGNLYGWGYNGHGQLGTGNTSNVTIPTLIDNGVSNVYASNGANNGMSTAYIKQNKLYQTGFRAYTKPPFLITQTTYSAADIPKDIVDVAFTTYNNGDNSAIIVLTKDNQVWGWGDSHGGVLGGAANEVFPYPIRIF